MLFDIRKIDQVEHGPKALMLAAEKGTLLASDSGFLGYGQEINGCDIQTILIQITGRFCERYASDLINTFDNLQPFLKGETDGEEGRWVIGVGIRDSGVDHNSFIMARLADTKQPYSEFVYPERVYRKLLVIDIQDKMEYGSLRRKIDLRDITYSLYRLDVPETKKSKEDKENAA